MGLPEFLSVGVYLRKQYQKDRERGENPYGRLKEKRKDEGGVVSVLQSREAKRRHFTT